MPRLHRIPRPVVTRSHALTSQDPRSCRHKVLCSDVTRSHILSSKEPPPVALRSHVLSSIPRPVVTRATSCRPQNPRSVVTRSHAQLLQDPMSSLYDTDSRSPTTTSRCQPFMALGTELTLAVSPSRTRIAVSYWGREGGGDSRSIPQTNSSLR